MGQAFLVALVLAVVLLSSGGPSVKVSLRTGTHPRVFPIANARITSPFGERPDPINPGKLQFHKGIDIAGPFPGARVDVVAPVEGTITSFELRASGGYRARLQDGQGFIHTFYHLAVPADLMVGMNVRRGQRLGTIGHLQTPLFDTRTAGVHCHWQIWDTMRQALVDPTDFARGGGEA